MSGHADKAAKRNYTRGSHFNQEPDYPTPATAPGLEDQHEKNMHILRLIRDEPAWALSRILRCEKLEAALRDVETFGDRAAVQIAREALKP